MWSLRLVGLLFAIALIIGGVQRGGAAEDFGQREVGRHVYDRAGLLTDAEVRDLEARAVAVERAGAPTIIYLREQKANQDDTQEDAQELMDVWDIQSSPDARDGIVIFLNLKPNDLRHGEAAIWAGQRHTDGGNLPESELRRIYGDVMAPRLSDEETAAGIGAGLDALANSLAFGPPPPPEPDTVQRAASAIAGLPLVLLGLIVSGVLAVFAGRMWGRRPTQITAGIPTVQRPDDLPPAVASALVARRIEPTALAEATLLDFARRGLVAIEPQGAKAVAIRLLIAQPTLLPFEQAVWSPLAAAADAQGVIAPKELSRVAKQSKEFQAGLTAELQLRGWFDPRVGALQRPLYLAGTVGMVLGVLGFIVALIGRQVPGLLCSSLVFVVGFIVLMLGAYFPRTTVQGEATAAPWHAYKAGLNAAARDRKRPLDLEVTLPDVVAFELVPALNRRIKEASEQGYAPSWFVRSSAQENTMVAFYPYWIALHSSVSPTSTSSSGGASAGGAGAGGSF
jgi:uncharacterized membrane protein YgcG